MFNRFMRRKKRLKTPTILQMEATECGAAAIAIVLAYYERYVALEELRVACGVSREGSKAVNMLQAARRYGLNAQGAKIEPEDLWSDEIKLPIIAFWAFNHFVVIEGIDEEKIYLNDPATGPRTVTPEEFDRSFTGIVLLFEPTPEFQPGGHKTTIAESVRPRLKPIKSALAFVIFASIALVIPGVIIPGFSKIFIDQVLIQHLNGWLLPLLWGIALTAILRMALTYLQQIYLTRLHLKMTLTSSARFLWHVLRLPIVFFSQRFAGDIESRVAANDKVAQWLSGDLSISMVSLFSMVFYLIIMFLYDWQLTIISALIAVGNVIVLWYVARRIENNSRRLQQELGKLAAIEMSALEAIETIKATSAEDDFFQQWSGYHAKTINSQQKIELYSRTLEILPQLLNVILTVTILGLGSWRIMQGYLTIGTLVAFQTLLASFNAPLLTLLGFGEKLQAIRADLTRLEDVMNHPEDPRLTTESGDTEIASVTGKLTGKLQFQQVSFGYSPLESPLLEQIDFTLEPGKRIALVGTSGSGKSTIAKLVCGLYQPWVGEILYDNQRIKNISAATLSHSLTFVDQQVFLFEGTVHDNLTLWNTNIADDDIERAIKDACLEPILAMRPKGLRSEVAYAGANFSGGQRQQLEIARALAVNPTILVLDEATSALDANTEHAIMENIKRRGHSLLMIAHRLSTIRDCDEIIVIAAGKIIERGTHQYLYEQQGAYFNLLQNPGEAGYAQNPA